MTETKKPSTGGLFSSLRSVATANITNPQLKAGGHKPLTALFLQVLPLLKEIVRSPPPQRAVVFYLRQTGKKRLLRHFVFFYQLLYFQGCAREKRFQI